ncbi:CapA family protein [Floccifex sp.]|uniref:CapA family protein n=1 Tax=Floccifex sp. TaxID=2815810 RepID=UPI003EFBB3E4
MKRKINYFRLAIVCIIPLVLIFSLISAIFHLFKKEPEIQTLSICATGDLLYEQGLYDWMDNYQFGSYLDDVLPYLDSDLTIANQEVPIGGKELGISGVAYQFNAPYEIANQYKDIGIDYVTFATNHSVDQGVQGIENTLSILDENGIGHTGAYTSQKQRDTISIVEKDGLRIAILAYTYATNLYSQNSYDVNYFLNEYGQFDQNCQDLIENDVKRAKKQADLVFVSMHWGDEFTFEVNDTQKEVASFLNDLGVDVIIGNHPHTIQPAETLVNDQGKETIVFYSLGNFISSAAQVSRASEDFENMYEIGAIATWDIVKEEENISIQNVKIIPIVNHFESNYSNFRLMPFSQYTENLASQHYQREYSSYFTVEWLSNQIHNVLDSSGFLKME